MYVARKCFLVETYKYEPFIVLFERKFEESKNPSYFVKAKDPRIDRDRNKILMLLVSVSLLKHINTNCSSFYSTKRKIERKFEESKNPSYFERSSNRSR